jgi:hypothetical protein
LWFFGFKPVIDALTDLPSSFFNVIGTSQAQLPTEDLAAQWARTVTFPARVTSLRKVIQGAIPRNFPGMVQALDTVRVDFLVQAGIDVKQSPTYAFFYAWRELARTGRTGGGVREAALLLDPGTFQMPAFQFDIGFNFMSGTADGAKLKIQSQYVMKNSWVRGLQPGAIDRTGSSDHQLLTVQFQASSVTELQ